MEKYEKCFKCETEHVGKLRDGGARDGVMGLFLVFTKETSGRCDIQKRILLCDRCYSYYHKNIENMIKSWWSIFPLSDNKVKEMKCEHPNVKISTNNGILGLECSDCRKFTANVNNFITNKGSFKDEIYSNLTAFS